MSHDTDTVVNGVRIEYRDKPHAYYVTRLPDGQRNRYPSVTGLLDGCQTKAKVEGLTRWYAQQGRAAIDILKQAGGRGDKSHDALEGFAATGTPPNPDQFDYDDRGYAQAIARFLLDAQPQFVSTEIAVASLTHGFAGRYDARVAISECDLVADATTGRRETIPSGLYLIDYKTGKRIYDEAFEQLAMYEAASVELGYPETDGQAVVRFTPDGTYEFQRSHVDSEIVPLIAQLFHLRKAYKTTKRLNEKMVIA